MGSYDVVHLAEDVLCSLNLFKALADTLPKEPGDGVDLWYDGGDDILCRTEEQANALADWLDQRGGYDSTTGYFDPAEDEREHCVDKLTGWYYVSV